jgi:hypothetical protein
LTTRACEESEPNKVLDEKWLLVYDNAEEWDTIKAYLPGNCSGSILITSQHQDFVAVTGGNETPLFSLDEYHGAQLLLKLLRKCSQEESEEARRISTDWGGLPLAIAHIGGYINKTGFTLAEFSKLCDSGGQLAHILSVNSLTSTHYYHSTLEKTWLLALSELSDDSRKCINILAMLNADGISEQLLTPFLSPSSTHVR